MGNGIQVRGLGIKKSIKARLIVTFVGIVVIAFVLIALSNSFLLERYYVAKKTDAIQDVYEKLNQYDSLTGDPQSDSFVIPFKNLINDSYCKDISMKIRSSLEVKQKSGEFVGSFAPYGYMKSPENKNQLIVDEAVSEYVQMIFSMYWLPREADAA